MKNLLLLTLMLVSMFAKAQVSITVSGTTHEVVSGEMLTIANAYAAGASTVGTPAGALGGNSVAVQVNTTREWSILFYFNTNIMPSNPTASFYAVDRDGSKRYIGTASFPGVDRSIALVAIPETRFETLSQNSGSNPNPSTYNTPEIGDVIYAEVAYTHDGIRHFKEVSALVARRL